MYYFRHRYKPVTLAYSHFTLLYGDFELLGFDILFLLLCETINIRMLLLSYSRGGSVKFYLVNSTQIVII